MLPHPHPAGWESKTKELAQPGLLLKVPRKDVSQAPLLASWGTGGSIARILKRHSSRVFDISPLI